MTDMEPENPGPLLKYMRSRNADRIEQLTAERDRLRGADVTQSCIICTGSGRVKVGVSFPPKSTIAVKVEYDPCPGCTPPPHTYHAKLVAKRLQEMRAALKGETNE